MLNGAESRMAGFAGHGGGCCVSATAGGNGVFYLLESTAMTSLTI